MFEVDVTEELERIGALHDVDTPAGQQAIAQYAVQMEKTIVQTAGYLNAMEYEFIMLLEAFDRHGLWYGDGIKSFAHWLNWKCGISPVVAREKVRIARAIRDLPRIDEAFENGQISYSKVRALTRVATAEHEEVLLDMAVKTTAAHLEQELARYRRTQVPGELPTGWIEYLEPRFSFRQDDHGMSHLYVKLPAEDGGLVEKAINKMVNKMRLETREIDGNDLPGRNPGDTTENHADNYAETKECGLQGKKVSAESSLSEAAQAFTCQRVTALARIAEHFLALPPGEDAKQLAGGDKYHVVLHVNANDKHRDNKINGGGKGDPCCYLEEGRFISPRVAERLCCDASVTTVLEDDNGKVLDIGRRSRVIPRNISLAVDIRDRCTCQFPNCHENRFTEKHHIITWASGGPTSLENLTTLCRFHHSEIHSGRFVIDKHGDQIRVYDDRGKLLERGQDPHFPIARPFLTDIPARRKTKPRMTAMQERNARIEATLEYYRSIFG